MSLPKPRIRPRITLKLATSLDGKIALSNGASEWITGERSRAAGRKLRATHDAIAVGANTAVIDNPQLTTRIAGAPNPERIIFDSRLRLSPDSNLARTAGDVPTVVFYDQSVKTDGHPLASTQVTLLPIPKTSDGLDISAALAVLRARGVSSLLVEGGGTLAASFLALGVIDVIEWFRAPMILGGDGRSAIGPLGLSAMRDVHSFARVELSDIGDDIYERYQQVKT